MEATNIFEKLEKAGKPAFYYTELAKRLNSVRDAVFLSYLIRLQSSEKSQDGWICKMIAEIQEETGLSRWEQKTARNNLKSLGILKEKYAGLPRKLYFKVDLEKLKSLLSKSEK